MSRYNWKKDLLTIPNLLSFFRLLLIPVYIHIYRSASQPLDYYLAGTVLGISCLTDLADGKIARSFHMISDAGKLLDPLADKLTQFALMITLSVRHPALHPVLGLFLIKETFQCVTMLLFMQRGKVLPGALFAGKICTTVLFSSLLRFVLFPDCPEAMVKLLVLLDTVSLVYAFGGYAFAYFGSNPKLIDRHRE